jgi:TonB family protein
MEDVLTIRRRFHRTELSWEDQFFLRLLSTLGIVAWCAVLWSQAFPPVVAQAPKDEEIQIARVILKPPPPPPEPEVVEPPKPQALPPRADETQKPGPPPAPKQAVKTAKAPAPAGAPKATAKRSVATMGLLSILSKSAPRAEAASQRIGASLQNVDFREARDLTEDVSSLTGTVGARDKVGIGQMVAGLPRGSGTQVVLKGSVVTPVTGPGGGASVGGAGSGGGAGAGGSRTLSEIRDVVASYIAGLKYLYDRELKSRPSLHGKVTVEFVVTAPGGVESVRLVSSGLGHPSLENAIVGRIRGWKFPAKPGDPTRVTFPFDFVPPTT